ncbi:putative membrane protein YhhN [Lacibacter cauensis]|uniref:Putative membrane protein YhhN n=1 Tax=Lacibacter cauensis TaxID=510947 RepID=A0A562SA86_9BACT|nr:lysoplasmalogenase [Lacibacter cauensis]TWI78285.1 putative membrane protein YhhN [Lacibacter cauensis]
MQQQSKLIFRIYALVVLLELLFIYLNQVQLRWFTKPLLMPLLMLAFYTASVRRSGTLFYLILAALFLSWCGDVLLQIEGLFIPGLVSFLLAHICYILYFTKTGQGKKGLLQLKPLVALPVLLYILLFLWLLFPYLNALKIPVTIYGITIGTMLLLALNTKHQLKNQTASLFITGAILFVISDSVLAVNLFAYKHLLLSLVVMATYSAAQYLIVKGAISNQDR